MTNFLPLTPSGGTTPYTYSYTGTLPPGLSFNPSTGVVSGTPTASYATADLVFSIKDANNTYADNSSTVSFTVSAGTVSSGSWSAAGDMSMFRYDHSATLLQSGKVLVTGGTGIASAELYDPTTNQFTATSSMIEPRKKSTATLLQNGKVLITGVGLGIKWFDRCPELAQPFGDAIGVLSEPRPGAGALSRCLLLRLVLL